MSTELTPAQVAYLRARKTCDHNVIPIRTWFRRRWICVRCDRTFREVPRR